VVDGMEATTPDVIVVGAGPAGLAAALALRSVGRTVTVLEAGAQDRLRPGSRAIFVHRDSILTLDRFHPGLARQLVAGGLVWQTKRTLYRGREVFSRTYDPPAPGTIPQFTSLPQIETERVLLDACRSTGVGFAWETEVAGVAVVDGVVDVTTTAGATSRARYVIGADGARSAVRKSLGIEMEGSRSEGHYVVVDVHEDPTAPRAVERVFHYEHPDIDGRNVLLVPFAGGWRIDLQLHESDDPADFADEAGVRRWLPRVMDPKYRDRLGWTSSYQFLQVVAKEFTDLSGRVLLIGEAAHLFAPFGARGMNSGIADAEAAANAIHIGLAATNPTRAQVAVAEFAASRLAAAQYNRAAAGSALEHLRPSTKQRLKQRTAARLASRVGRFGEWLERAPYGPRGGAATATRGRY
jgi:3-(3-hydroxy-phenyl)propionate hydroxylase